MDTLILEIDPMAAHYVIDCDGLATIKLNPVQTVDGIIYSGPPLYKYDTNDKLRIWSMDLHGDKRRFITGLADGKLTVGDWTDCVGKQKRNDAEQALFEIRAEYVYNLKREYFQTPEAAQGGARFFLPMLAEKWKDCYWDGAMKKLAKAGFQPKHALDTGFYYQHKFDGFCCIAQKSGLTSREGEPIISAPHVMEALQPFFDQYPDGVLHGELYHHALKDNFQKLSSILKKKKNITDEMLAFSRQMAQLHVYDYPSPHVRHLPFSERSALLAVDLADVFAHPEGIIQKVETTLVRDAAHVDELMSESLLLGYEGGIGRLDLGEYVQKRSWQVLKIKEFEDAEFRCVGIEDGDGSYKGFAKAGKFLTEDDKPFGAGIKGGLSDFNRDLFENPQSQSVATITFFGRSNEGIPRMGVVKVWHGHSRTL